MSFDIVFSVFVGVCLAEIGKMVFERYVRFHAEKTLDTIDRHRERLVNNVLKEK